MPRSQSLTLGRVSNDAGDSASRLSDAIDEIFSGGRRTAAPSRSDDGRPDDSDDSDGADGGDGAHSPDGPDTADDTRVDDPYELPEIVPATADPVRADDARPADSPRLPPRATVPDSTTGEAGTITPSTSTGVPATAHRAPVRGDGAATPTAPAVAPASPSAPATGWADHMATRTSPTVSHLRAPGRRPRVRRVTRVVRHVDPWSTFKVALLFNAVGYIVCLTSGVLLWRVADSTGTLDNVERWFTQFGWETFELDGGAVFHNAWIIGLFGVVAATGGAVLLVTLFNLVSDIVGGVRMTVLEEEVVERTISSTRRYVVRRPTDATTAGGAADGWSTDDLGDDPEPPRDAVRTSAPAPDPADLEAVDRPRDGHDEPTRPVRSPSAPTADWSVD